MRRRRPEHPALFSPRHVLVSMPCTLSAELVAVHAGSIGPSNDVVTIRFDRAELGSPIDGERAGEASDQADRRLQHDHDAEGAARRAPVPLAAAGGFAVG